MQVYVKLVNHPVHGVKLVIYKLANCVNSFCSCIKMSVPVYKILHVKGPLGGNGALGQVTFLSPKEGHSFISAVCIFQFGAGLSIFP